MNARLSDSSQVTIDNTRLRLLRSFKHCKVQQVVMHIWLLTHISSPSLKVKKLGTE